MSGYTAPGSYSSPAGYNSDARDMARTPSPTPSEIYALNQTTIVNYRAFFQRDKVLTKKYLMYYAIGIVIIVVATLLIIFDKQIVHAIQPAANWMHNLRFGWLIPIGIFFIISFPPLFGHEILAIVCGLVWGVWGGFAITAAGTLLGEIGNFYAFRYLLRSRAEKEERESILYACLAKVVREGGFKIAVIVRYSAVPGHFTTAIFAVCGMNIFVFILAAILSMPKQFITVYIGVLMEDTANGTTSTQNKIASYVVATVTVLVTIAAMWYIQKQVSRVKPDVIYARRKARQEKLKLNGDGLYQNSGMNGSNDDSVFNPNASDINLTTSLTHSDAPYDPPYQRWDKDGRAVGYAPDPLVVAPQPRRVNNSLDALVAPPRTGSATGSSRPRQESTDTVGWELHTNATEGQSYPMHTIPEPPSPVAALHNPFDNESSETIIAPIAPSPGSGEVSSPVAEYAFSSQRHSYGAGKQPERAFSPPPPSYRS